MKAFPLPLATVCRAGLNGASFAYTDVAFEATQSRTLPWLSQPSHSDHCTVPGLLEDSSFLLWGQDSSEYQVQEGPLELLAGVPGFPRTPHSQLLPEGSSILHENSLEPGHCAYSGGPQPYRCTIFFLTEIHCYPVPFTSTA